MDSVRVDDGCYTRLTTQPVPKYQPPPSTGAGSANRDQPRDAPPHHSDFEDDLQRALKLSLEEQSAGDSSGYVPSSQSKQHQPPPNGTAKPSTTEEEDDPELRAAVEASLRDMEQQKTEHAAALKRKTEDVGAASPSTYLAKRDFELSAAEAENINLFSCLVERMQHQPPGTILREPQLQELYDSIRSLKPKLARTLGEVMSKHDALLELHSKLAGVVRIYDRMLEERLSSAYVQPSYGVHGYDAPFRAPDQTPANQQPNYFPSQSQSSVPSVTPHIGAVQPSYNAFPQVYPSATPFPQPTAPDLSSQQPSYPPPIEQPPPVSPPTIFSNPVPSETPYPHQPRPEAPQIPLPLSPQHPGPSSLPFQPPNYPPPTPLQNQQSLNRPPTVYAPVNDFSPHMPQPSYAYQSQFPSKAHDNTTGQPQQPHPSQNPVEESLIDL